VTYLHPDHLGTPKFGTNAGGTQVWAWAPDAFGNGSPSGAATVNLRMPGQFYDAESSLFYNWNRYYNPATGRYISSDPIGLEGGINTFLYAAASPVMYIDPIGLVVEAVYDKTTGILTVTDADTGKVVSAPAFSGMPEFNFSAAPNGTYTISDFPWGRSAFEHYFALLRHDRNLDDTADGFPSNYGRGDMSNLRLHAGDASHGCVTVPYAPDSSEWSQIQEMLEKTRRGAPITIQKQTYPNFGTLKIIGEDYESLPK